MPTLAPHAELAIFARALFREGWNDSVAGHITYRQADDTLLTLPYELGWNEVCVSDVLKIDMNGTKLEGLGKVPTAIGLHLEFHRAHPGCDVTVHHHPRFTTVWSAVGRVPPVYDQRGGYVPDDDIVFYDDYVGGVASVEAARAAVDGIGGGKCCILRNHGAFVVADSIPQAFTRATSLERRCEQAWYVESIGGCSAMPSDGREKLERVVAPSRGYSAEALGVGGPSRASFRPIPAHW